MKIMQRHFSGAIPMPAIFSMNWWCTFCSPPSISIWVWLHFADAVCRNTQFSLGRSTALTLHPHLSVVVASSLIFPISISITPVTRNGSEYFHLTSHYVSRSGLPACPSDCFYERCCHLSISACISGHRSLCIFGCSLHLASLL